MTASPLPRSSGDTIANRRADYAEMMFGEGQAAAAAELMMSAMEIAPGWTLGWFRLGEFHEAAGAMAEAEQAFRMCLKLDPVDQSGAALKLALAGASEPIDRPPSAFVEALFDQYAPTFDASLVGKLGYKAPDLLAAAIGAASTMLPPQPDGGEGLRLFRRALDLGCGTGLMGERLRPLVDELIGYDISAAMLKKAAAKNVYDRLEKVDLQTLDGEGFNADLVTAADVFLYLGALDRIARTAHAMLQLGGLFAFSVEAHDGDGDFVLLPSRRYAHSEAYIRRLLEMRGFTVLALERGTIRLDRKEPIQGLIVVAQA